MPTYTKLVSRHDLIELDGTDYSNCFRTFGMTSADTLEDASGFSVSGVDENLPGARAQGFAGEAFYTEEFAAAIWPMHNNRTVVQVQWTPNGLVNTAAKTYYAMCTIGEFSPSDTRGSVSTTPFTATVADENGITQGTGT
jgi:hypothetical protein